MARVKTAAASRVATPPRRILVPLDFSVHSTRALEYAAAFARRFGARIILIHVIESFPIDHILGGQIAKQAHQMLFEQARSRLGQVVREFFAARQASADSLVAFGKPFQEIVKAAKEQSADLIIIATHGYTGLKHIQLGSTAERVVRHAPCPVLVLRAELNGRGRVILLPKDNRSEKRDGVLAAVRKTKVPFPLKVRKILVPVDFSPRSGTALAYAVAIARRFHASITLLHVVHADYYFASNDYSVFDYPELVQEVREAGKKQLGDLARSIGKICRVTTELATGHPGNLIVEAAKRLGSDLVILSTRGRTGLKRAFLGSTAEYVVRYAACPVLALHERVQEPALAKTPARNDG